MNNTEFTDVMEKQFQRSEKILAGKAAEYATDTDRLHNFKVVSELQNIPMRLAVANLMSKHTVSIYDLARSDKHEPMDMWDEKITDHINYLILLKAVLTEEANAQTTAESNPNYPVHNPNV